MHKKYNPASALVRALLRLGEEEAFLGELSLVEAREARAQIQKAKRHYTERISALMNRPETYRDDTGAVGLKLASRAGNTARIPNIRTLLCTGHPLVNRIVTEWAAEQ